MVLGGGVEIMDSRSL